MSDGEIKDFPWGKWLRFRAEPLPGYLSAFAGREGLANVSELRPGLVSSFPPFTKPSVWFVPEPSSTESNNGCWMSVEWLVPLSEEAAACAAEWTLRGQR